MATSVEAGSNSTESEENSLVCGPESGRRRLLEDYISNQPITKRPFVSNKCCIESALTISDEVRTSDQVTCSNSVISEVVSEVPTKFDFVDEIRFSRDH